MYVVFEGLDGSGKSTIINRIYNRMIINDHLPLPVTFRFPCPLDKSQPGGVMGNLIREAMAKTRAIQNEALMYLFMAEAVEFDAWAKRNRREHALLLDRHAMTTGPVYQQDHHRKDEVIDVYRSYSFTAPDAVLIFDIDYQTHIARRRARNNQHEDLLFERDDEPRFARMRADYLSYLTGDHPRFPKEIFHRIDAMRSIEEVEEQAWSQLRRFM